MYMRKLAMLAILSLATASSSDSRPITAEEWGRGHFCGTQRGPAGAEVARHLANMRRMERAGMPAVFDSAGNKDYGNIAVIEATAQSGILLEKNPFDLKQRSIKFKRNADKTYNIQFVTTAFDGTAGIKLDLSDDDAELIQYGFTFPFFDKTYTSGYLNTDGNLTMEQSDTATSARNFTRFNSMPRIGPLFDDLNPQQGGEVLLAKTADRLIVTWNNVPEWSSTATLPPNRFQVILYKSGDIQFNYSDTMSPQQVIVGITPGLTGDEVPDIPNYSDDLPLTSVEGAIGEVFSQTREIDYFSIVRSFLTSHTDSYDSILMFTSDRDIQIIPRGSGAWAFEQTVKNDVRGIGLDVFDFSEYVGAAGRFRSIVVMDYLARFPNDPYQVIPSIGENSTVSVMGQEVGHLWLVFPEIIENGQRTQNLLGRDDAHWSFFFDSDASVMEGNDIQDNGNGTFTTTATVDRYSLLDQYIIGLRPSSQVPDSFYVSGADGDPGTGPRTGITFSGTRVNVNVGQVIAAEGQRNPSWDKAQHVFNQAFVLLVPAGETPSQADLSKLETIRTAWTDFFNKGVDNKGVANTSLTGGSFQGFAKDKKGIALANIPITVKSKKHGIVWTVKTAADGSYALNVLIPGGYELTGKRGSKQVKKASKIVSTETVTVDFVF